MKNLQEKFDQLPQDFDRMAIWKEIELPKRSFLQPKYIWSFLLGLAVVGLSVLGITHTNTPDSTQATVAESFTLDETVGIGRTDGGIMRDKTGKLSKPNEGNVSKRIVQKSPPSRPSLSSKSAFSLNPGEEKESFLLERSTESKRQQVNRSREKEVNVLPNIQRVELAQRENGISILRSHLLNRALIPLKKAHDPLPTTPNLDDLPPPKHSLTLQAGLGMHRSHFSLANEGGTNWRKELEKPQLDYSLALRYERETKRHFLLSLTASYHLFRDQIQTSFLREQALVEYDLYNQYHVFSTQFAVGKRFYQPAFFWDVMGGVGLSLAQVSDTDFFVAKDKLADEAYLNQVYDHSLSVYPTIQTAMGKHLGDRFLVRMGVQASAGLGMTNSNASNRHSLISIHAFLEGGVRF